MYIDGIYNIMSASNQYLLGMLSLGNSFHGTDSYTSPSTWAWTCPSGVRTISIQGKGGTATADSWGTINTYTAAYSYSSIQYYCSNPVVGNPLTYSTYNSYWNNLYNYLNSTVTTSSSGAYVDLINAYFFFWCIAANTWVVRTDRYAATYRRGTLSGTAPPTSGNVTTADSTSRFDYINGVQLLNPGMAGGDTTGFGYTFFGGLSPITSTYDGIQVVAGQTYYITVPNGSPPGSLTITY